MISEGKIINKITQMSKTSFSSIDAFKSKILAGEKVEAGAIDMIRKLSPLMILEKDLNFTLLVAIV